MLFYLGPISNLTPSPFQRQNRELNVINLEVNIETSASLYCLIFSHFAAK
jgi:hypothetical protein